MSGEVEHYLVDVAVESTNVVAVTTFVEYTLVVRVDVKGVSIHVQMVAI